MSRGLGLAQRAMLVRLAVHEVATAERAAEMQRPYRSPDRWSLQALAGSTFRPELHFPRGWKPGQYRSSIALELTRFNPSRAILGLEARGFVLRNHYYRISNLALTREGFAEARRLVAMPSSESVDLDEVEARWRDPEDFWLGPRLHSLLRREDDAPW